MKKILLATIAMVGLAAFAQAETIDLYTTSGFGYLHQYHDIDTSLPDVTVTIYLPQTGTGTASLWFGEYGGGLWTGPYLGSGIPTVLINAATGGQLTVVLNETSYRKQINSGRAHYWVTKWTLLSGKIDR